MDKRLRWLNNLLCFEVAARHQSYSRAAQELFVSQAAVSQQMRQLEKNLGVSLFRRKARKMELTPQGHTLLQACQKGFSEVVHGLNQVQEEPIEGDLTVSSTQAFCALWLVPRLYEFSVQYPQINVNVQGSNHVEDLREGKVDLAVRFSTTTEKLKSPLLNVDVVGDDACYPVCTPTLQSRLSIHHPEHLLKVRLLSLEGESVVNWESWFEHVGVSFTPKKLQKTLVTSSDLSLSAVLAGHGAMLASDIMVGSYLRSGQLVKLSDIPHPARWKSHLVSLKNSPKQKRIQIFSNWIKEHLVNEAI